MEEAGHLELVELRRAALGQRRESLLQETVDVRPRLRRGEQGESELTEAVHALWRSAPYPRISTHRRRSIVRPGLVVAEVATDEVVRARREPIVAQHERKVGQLARLRFLRLVQIEAARRVVGRQRAGSGRGGP